MRIQPKKLLVFLVMLGLFLPLLQQQFGWVEERKLHGWFPALAKPQPDLGNWLEGRYQDSLQLWANGAVGFRNTLFRLHNQYHYSLFRIAKANGVVIGKEHFLYDRAHIDAYTGRDFIGEAALKERFRKLGDLARVWRQKKIHFQIVYAPAKATAVPEHLPSHVAAPGSTTNLSRHLALGDSLRIHQLDLVSWFKARKKSDPNPLYPAGGIHWSNYCAALAADTIAGAISRHTGQPLNRFRIDSLRHSDHEEGEDGDVALGMNLLFPLPSRPAVYPITSLQKRQEPHTRILTVGDSFFWHIFSHYTQGVYAEAHFFFYFNEPHDKDKGAMNMAEIDLLRELETRDVIQLFSSEANLSKLGWGFIEAAWEVYFNPEKRAPHLQRIKDQIRKDSNWMTLLTEKSAQQGLPLDTILHRDAIWVWENDRHVLP